MRHYDVGKWGVLFIFTLRGSVIPKTLVWAVPSALFSVLIHFMMHDRMDWTDTFMEQLGDTLTPSQVWAGYNFLIAFLLSFRTGKAYSRWWEGGTLLQQARGEWFNAFSSLIAFSSHDPRNYQRVHRFHRLLATLMSNLFCASLNTISQKKAPFEVLNLAPLSEDGVEFLNETPEKVELILLWIQRLIVESTNEGLIPVPAPILSRVYQELSRGVVNINNIRKISEFLFPFPYAQLITSMLLLNTILTPIVIGILLHSVHWAAVVTFVSVFAFWSLNYVASEIECPFGDDDNDLPMHYMQEYFNRTLQVLLQKEAQIVPRGDEHEFESIPRSVLVNDFMRRSRRSESLNSQSRTISFVFQETGSERNDSKCSHRASIDSLESARGMTDEELGGFSGFTPRRSHTGASNFSWETPDVKLGDLEGLNPEDWDLGIETTPRRSWLQPDPETVQDDDDLPVPPAEWFSHMEGQLLPRGRFVLPRHCSSPHYHREDAAAAVPHHHREGGAVAAMPAYLDRAGGFEGLQDAAAAVPHHHREEDAEAAMQAYADSAGGFEGGAAAHDEDAARPEADNEPRAGGRRPAGRAGRLAALTAAAG